MWIKIAVAELEPLTLVAYRVSFGTLFCIGVILAQRTPLPKTLKEWMPLFILGITNVVAPFFLITWGEKSIDSGVASILNATVPLFTILAAHFILQDDKMTAPKVIGLLMGFAGVIVLMSEDIGSSHNSVIGQIAIIVASIFYAGSSIYIRKVTQNTPPILRSAGPLFSATVVTWVMAFAAESPIAVPVLPITWIALVWLGVLGSGLAFLIAFQLNHDIGPTRATMITYLLPLGGVTLGAIFLDERITWQVLVGAILIIASLFVANRKV